MKYTHRLLLALLLPLAPLTLADCACGYTVNKTHEPHFAIFTDLLETDFLHTYDFSSPAAADMGWAPQTYNQTNSTGPYGMAKSAANVVANPLGSVWDWGGEGMGGGDPGLQMWVRRGLVQGEGDGEAFVPSAEVVSGREDILYGSFRIAMKTTSVDGTCAAFFFYRNDSQEIDVELLSAQQYTNVSQWPVNLVVQNTSVPLALNGSGPQSSNMEFYMVRQPDGGVGAPYHEYRFDWLPDRVDFYVDGWPAMTFRENVPSTPGAIHFSHWSNGNPSWSRGPPLEDAVTTVAYVKAYFNTTNGAPSRGHDCNSPQWRAADKGFCEIPDENNPPWPGGPDGNATGRTFFFSREVVKPQPHGTDLRPPMGGANAMGQMREKALWTAIAVFGVPVAAVLTWRLL